MKKGLCVNVPVPQANILIGASKLISQAHTHNIFCVLEYFGHCTKAFQPFIRIKVLVSKEAIIIGSAAAPSWSGHLVIKYDHDILAGQSCNHFLFLSNSTYVRNITSSQYKNSLLRKISNLVLCPCHK
jgi:hypothetical protein